MQVVNAGSLRHEQSVTCKAAHIIHVQHKHAAARHKALQQQCITYETAERRQLDLFKYLGRPLSNAGNVVLAMRGSLKRARDIWVGFSKILRTEEIPFPIVGMFHQAVIAAGLLYGSKSWNLPPSAMKVLEGFRVEAARRLMGMMPQKRGDHWVYPKSAEVLVAAQLKTRTKCIAIRW